MRELGGGKHPPGLVVVIGAEFGGAFHSACGRRGASAALRDSCAVLQQCGDVLVWSQRGGRQVPRVTIGPVANSVRDLQVRGGALGEGGAVVDRRSCEGMGE